MQTSQLVQIYACVQLMWWVSLCCHQSTVKKFIRLHDNITVQWWKQELWNLTFDIWHYGPFLILTFCAIVLLNLQLNFVGVTVDPQRKYVHFPSNRHMFAPVPIGLASHPRQVYELFNGGALPVTYQLDLTALETVQQVTYGFWHLYSLVFALWTVSIKLHHLYSLVFA